MINLVLSDQKPKLIYNPINLGKKPLDLFFKKIQLKQLFLKKKNWLT
jgi:hypothetical protein